MLASFPTFNNLNTVKYESECSEKTELSSGCRYLTGFTFHHSEVGNKVTQQDADGCCVCFVSLQMGDNADGGEHLSLKVISEARTVWTKCPGETNKQFLRSCRECDPTTAIDIEKFSVEFQPVSSQSSFLLLWISLSILSLFSLCQTISKLLFWQKHQIRL